MSRGQGQTSVWVPIDDVVPHPKNPNEMDETMTRKLAAGIAAVEGQYTPIVVRSLERSEDYKDLHADGKFQILDGEHRWKQEKSSGAPTIHVCVWTNITDAVALVLLTSLNGIRGASNKRKRSTLLKDLYARTGDIEAMSSVLPMEAKDIRKLVEEDPAAAAARIEAGATMDRLSRMEPLTIFVLPSHKSTVQSAIKRWLDEHDPRSLIVEAREGHALAALCEESAPAGV